MAFDELNVLTVYMQTFDDEGNYSGTWKDITKYVNQLGEINIQIDDTDYDIGIFRNSSLDLKLNNRDGQFNDVDTSETFFNYKRKNTLIKVTYQIAKAQCGIVKLPFLQGDEVEIFKGLLNDESLRTSAKSENANFIVLGIDSLLDEVLVNFSSLSIGDSIEEIIYKILNQVEITGLLNVSASNINCGLDQDSDAVAGLEGKTVSEALEVLLFISNSILYIDGDDNIIVSNREPSLISQHTFYGQASRIGPENIIDIQKHNNGFHRLFNYFIWEETTTVSQDNDSIAENGIKKKEISSSLFTNSTKRTNVMDALLAEFKDKKIEMEITVPLDYKAISLNLLDKINIDYPAPVISKQGEEVPLYGIAILGEAVFPSSLWSLKINITTDFKILSKSFVFDSYIVKLKLREV